MGCWKWGQGLGAPIILPRSKTLPNLSVERGQNTAQVGCRAWTKHKIKIGQVGTVFWRLVFESLVKVVFI